MCAQMMRAQMIMAGLMAGGLVYGQNSQGEAVFAQTCATGYCHGAKGTASGAPRLAGRGFDVAYISGVVTRGIPGTSMPAFSVRMPPPALAAVIGYVASLNGISVPNPTGGQPATTAALSAEASRGAQLFKEAARSFGRCSTCHELGGFGIPVAAPIVHAPDSVAALKSLATPAVKTATAGAEAMPALVLSDGKRSTVFYDLTSVPPVDRNAEPGSVKFADGSAWRHLSVIGAYNDSELAAILAYLRETIKP